MPSVGDRPRSLMVGDVSRNCCWRPLAERSKSALETRFRISTSSLPPSKLPVQRRTTGSASGRRRPRSGRHDDHHLGQLFPPDHRLAIATELSSCRNEACRAAVPIVVLEPPAAHPRTRGPQRRCRPPLSPDRCPTSRRQELDSWPCCSFSFPASLLLDAPCLGHRPWLPNHGHVRRWGHGLLKKSGRARCQVTRSKRFLWNLYRYRPFRQSLFSE